MSENALGYLLNRAGYHRRHVPHGWRTAFSTIMNERFRPDREVIDMMLSHGPKDEVEAVYNGALHAARRCELAQLWADLLMVAAGGRRSRAKERAVTFVERLPRRRPWPDEPRARDDFSVPAGENVQLWLTISRNN